MNKLFLIAISNIKKKKGAMSVIGLLLVLATILLYTSITVLTNIDNNMQKRYAVSNLADIEYLVPEGYDEQVTNIVNKESGIIDQEHTPALFGLTCHYSSTKDGKTQEVGMIFENVDETTVISKNTANYDKKNFAKNGIILCQYLESTGAYHKGDKFYLHGKDKIYEFIVEGFSEDGNFATPLNYSIQKAFISEEYMEQLSQESDNIHPITDYKLKLNDYKHGSEIEKRTYENIICEFPELIKAGAFTLSWQNMRGGVAIIPSISMGIILAFAIILIIIVLSVVYYNIKNFMDEDLPNIGILKASGYTSFELSLSMIIEIMLISIVSVILGLILGFLFTPILGNLVAAMMGLLWSITIDVKAAIISALSILLVIFLIVYLISRKYKKLFVLDALRGGITTHYFKKNLFSLDKSRFSLITSLGLKNLLFERRKNIILAIIITFLTFANCEGLFMYHNFGQDDDFILKFAGIEVSPVIISTNDSKYNEFDPTTISGIKKARYGGSSDVSVSLKDSTTYANCDFWDNISDLRFEQLSHGRLPESDKEIVLSKGIKDELNAKIGDIVYLKCGNRKADFMVVGFDQKVNHYGRKTLVSLDGFKRLFNNISPTGIYLDLEDGYSFNDVKNSLAKAYPTASIGDGEMIVNSTISGLKSVMTAICAFFLITTLIIVFLILFMIGKSRIIEQRKMLGINKALGFTTRQLILQNLVSITPTIVIGCLLGIILAIFGTNPMISFIMSSFAAGEYNYPPLISQYLLILFVILADALLVTFITSSKIRKIEPIKMLRE